MYTLLLSTKLNFLIAQSPCPVLTLSSSNGNLLKKIGVFRILEKISKYTSAVELY